MINQFENRFRIKRVLKTSDDDYITALRIYNETTPYDIKTNTNEITHWIEKRSESAPFEVYAFILYFGSEVIGLSITTYLRQKKTTIDEYLAVKDHFRINVVFLTFLSLIQNFYSENSIEVSFFLTEISNKDNGKNINKESQISLKILCLEAYGKIDALYYTLPLGIDHFESNFEAFLYIKSSDNISKITKETYLTIIESIYFDYYYNWYSEFLTSSQMEEYKKKIEHYFELIKKNILSSHIPTLDVLVSNCSILNFSDKYEKTHGPIPVVKGKNRYLIPIIVSVLLVFPLLVILGYNLVLSSFGIALNSISTVIGSILSASITSITAVCLAKNKL